MLVDDKDCPIAVAALFIPDAVGTRDIAFGVEVRQQRKAQIAKLLGKGTMGVDTVDADAQDLDVGQLEARDVALESSQLGLSAPREIENIKGQYYMLLAEICVETYQATHRGGKIERRSRLTERRQVILAHKSLPHRPMIIGRHHTRDCASAHRLNRFMAIQALYLNVVGLQGLRV